MLKPFFRTFAIALLMAAPAARAGVTLPAVPTTTTNTTAPSTPAAGTTAIWVDATNKTLEAKNDAGVVSQTVQTVTCAAHQFVNQVNAAGAHVCAQPAASDVSGLAPSATTDTTNASNIASGTLPPGQLPSIPTPWPFGDGTTLAAGATKWLPCSGVIAHSAGAYGELVSETGHLERLFLKSTPAPGTGQSVAATVYINGSASALTQTISGTATAASDTTDAAAIAAGQTCDVQFVTSSGATTLELSGAMSFYKP